ncbi:MAG: saccharopine dehydrogenase NADP-binding domain-containing protein [Comamonadaceae bacterium]|nr:saccharopine dehydrogenase NADP-binding domain-containing protein [Comamonadaceae bacterium]
MSQHRLLILGGYGNAGLAIARLLAAVGDLRITLAGRGIRRALDAAGRLNTEFGTDRFSGLEVHAASRESLLAAFNQVDLVIVAASTIAHTKVVAEAALEAGIDYLDVQISVKAKHDALEPLRERLRASGRCFITDGGFRPGIPGAMVRYAASLMAGLASAAVSSAFQVNWQDREFSASSATEFVEELKSFSSRILKDGAWQSASLGAYQQVDFGNPFGIKYCAPMFLEEFQDLPGMIPTLKDTGFYSSGLGKVVDYVIIPLAFGLLALSPEGSRNLIARLMEWGLKHTTRPPYGAVLQMDACGQGQSLRMKVSHTDAYVVTAAPAVACLFQYFDGSIRKPGLWKQATLVEPVRFFGDVAKLGLQVKAGFGDESKLL